MSKERQAQNLAELLNREGLRQNEFARIIGVWNPQVSYWVNGQRGISVESAKKICAAFPAYDLDFILGNTQPRETIDKGIALELVKELKSTIDELRQKDYELAQKHKKLLKDYSDLMSYCERLEQGL